MTTNDARLAELRTLPMNELRENRVLARPAGTPTPPKSVLREMAQAFGVPMSHLPKERLAREIVGSLSRYEAMAESGEWFDATLDEWGDPHVGPSVDEMFAHQGEGGGQMSTEKRRASAAGPVKDPKTNKWGFVIDLGVGGDGKRKQARRRGLDTKKQASEALTVLRSEVQTQTYVAPAKQTLSEFLDEWLAAIEHTVERSTHSSYKRNVRLHVKPAIGGMQLQRLDAAHLNKLYTALRDGLSVRTVRYIHTIIHRALRDAVKWSRVMRNVADAVDPPRARDACSPEMRTWTGDELGRFFSLIVQSRYRTPWLVLATTGMRRGEVLGLRWRDVDLDVERLDPSNGHARRSPHRRCEPHQDRQRPRR